MREALTVSCSVGISVPVFGYTVWKRDGLTQLIAHDLPVLAPALAHMFPDAVPTSAYEVLEQVASLDVELWPHEPGPVTRAVGDVVVVDVYAATRRLQRMATMPRALSGQLTNVVSEKFELFIQDGLDRSEWVPSDKIRALRGRHLKLNGKQITDIDAIGQCGNRVLLVSCKNVPYSPEYDAGELRAVQNAEVRIDEAVDKWRDTLLATLRASPVGDNYDLSGTELLGVVVTPHVMFSRATSSNEPIDLDPLRAASGAGELFKAVGAAAAWIRPAAPATPRAGDSG